MRAKNIFLLCAALSLSACVVQPTDDRGTPRSAAGDDAVPAAAVIDAVDRLLAAFAAERDALDMPPLAIRYVENLENLGAAADLQRQEETLTKWRDLLSAVDRETLSACQSIDLWKAQQAIDRGIERASLGQRFLAMHDGDIPEGGLQNAPLGRAWYAYFLKTWLGADVDPDEIFAFGEAEIAEANAQYDALIKAAGLADDPAALKAHLSGDQYLLTDEEEIDDTYRAVQAVVRRNLTRQFLSDYGAPEAIIKRAGEGPLSATPGYYDISAKTFFYNLVNGQYDIRQKDWLFLHEATPGHHFQLWVSNEQNACDSALPDIRSPAFLEGWAAYVETLGRALGLYRSPELEMSAVEWNMVRSARVAIDVGLNYYGWSDEEALDYWRENVQGGADIAAREIARMRRWPAQVVTYKYGAEVFEKMKAEMSASQGEEFDVRAYHDLALRYGDMPLDAFEDLIRTHGESHGRKADK